MDVSSCSGGGAAAATATGSNGSGLGSPTNGCKCKFVPHWLRRADLEVVLEEDSARQRRHCVVVAVVVGATCVSHKCGGETRSELVFLVLNTECIPASRLTA